MSCDSWTKDKPVTSSPHFLRRHHFSLLFAVMASLLAGCAHGMSHSSLSSMMSGNRISGQFEPDVDYEAEAAARARQSKSSEKIK